MKNFLFIIIFLILTSCAHHSKNNSASLSDRAIASQAFEIDEFMENLNRGLRIFPHLGNPRFYLFEHFVNRANVLTTSLNQENQTTKLLSLWASYKVMSEAGIYLNFSFLVNKDSVEVASLLQAIDQEMGTLQEKISHLVKLEEQEKAIQIERKNLIQSLAKRIDRSYKIFVKNERDQLFVKYLLSNIRNLQTNIIDFQVLTILSDPKYKKAQRLLSNLSLIENGNIDGLDESYEKVMSVQMSAELIHWLFERELRN